MASRNAGATVRPNVTQLVAGRAEHEAAGAASGVTGAGTTGADTGVMTTSTKRFPSRTDLEFYTCKQRLPAWAVALRERQASLSAQSLIDECVNAHAGARATNGEMAAWNLLSILQSMRQRGRDLSVELGRIAETPGCLIDPSKRAAFARKWQRRMEKHAGAAS